MPHSLSELDARIDSLLLQVADVAAKLKQPPSITNLVATPASLPAGGGSVTISATIKNATSITVDGTAATLPVTRQVTSSHTFNVVAHGQKLPDATASVTVPVAVLAKPLAPTGLRVQVIA